MPLISCRMWLLKAGAGSLPRMLFAYHPTVSALVGSNISSSKRLQHLNNSCMKAFTISIVVLYLIFTTNAGERTLPKLPEICSRLGIEVLSIACQCHFVNTGLIKIIKRVSLEMHLSKCKKKYGKALQWKLACDALVLEARRGGETELSPLSLLFKVSDECPNILLCPFYDTRKTTESKK